MFNNERPIRKSVFIYPSQYKILLAIAETRKKSFRDVILECFNLYLGKYLKGSL